MLYKSTMSYKSKVYRILHSQQQSHFKRSFVDDLEIKFVRDRGLDHAIEREKDLIPFINLKNLLKLEPAKSLSVSTIVDYKKTLKLPSRLAEFVRKYPSVFEEFFLANLGTDPHVRLTAETLDLDKEEQLIFDGDTVRKNTADRLLKLLMLCRVNRIPLALIDRLKWDLGLPDNYVNSLIPEFPDYFQIKDAKGSEKLLELVCWSDELSVSKLEKMARKGGKNYKKGMPIEFPMTFSNGFEMDKRLEKWIDEWQKLPYISPYENAALLQPNSDESDKWAAAVLHEFLSILVPKKTEREKVLTYGSYLGVKPRIKRAMANHSGIFYVSSKNETHTVVLREGYKRGVLIDKDPLMEMRSKYIHLMRTVKEDQKPKNTPSGDSSKASKQKVVGGGVEKENGDDGKEEEEKMEVSDSDLDESDDEDEDESDDEDEEKERSRGRSGRRGFSEVNEDDQRRGGHRGGRGGFSRVSEENQGRGGRSGRRGFNKDSEEGRERGGSRTGRRGFNEEGRERGGRGRRGFEARERGANMNERKGFGGQERGGVRSGRGAFNRGNEGGEERRGGRSGRGGFNRGNEGQERSGGRSGRGGFSKFSGRREFSKGNEEGNERRSGGRSGGRRESGHFSEGRRKFA